MNDMSPRRIIAVLLAVFVTLGLSASVVQAGNMSLKMSTVVSEMTMAGHGDCPKCGGDDGKTVPICVTACAMPIIVLPAPSSLGGRIASRSIAVSVSGDQMLPGRAPPPDPYPPRPSARG